jgi:hypothetical protein
VDVRNRLATGDIVEIMSPGRPLQNVAVKNMTDYQNACLPVAHAGMKVRMALNVPCGIHDVIRRCEPSTITSSDHG